MTDVTHTSRSPGFERRPVRTPGVDRALVVVAVLASVVGTLLRFWPRRSLWLDEALSVNIAELPLGDIPAALKRDGHPPLYYVLLHLWSLGGSSDWWVRALSGLVATAGLPLAYLAGARLGRRATSTGLGSRRTGLLVLSLWAVLPFAVRYGAEARMYALVSTLVLVAYLLVDGLVAEPGSGRMHPLAAPGTTARKLHATGLALVTAALLYSHYWALWLGAATALMVAVIGFQTLDGDRRSGAWTALGAMAAGVVLFVPWMPTMLYQSSHTGTPWGEVFRPATMLVVSVTDFVGGGFGEMQVMSYALVFAITVAVIGSIRDRSGKQVIELTGRPGPRIAGELSVFLLTMAVGWATAMVASATYASRYAAVVAPLFALCAGAGLAMIRTRRATWVLTALVCTALVVGSVAEVVTDRTQARVVADALATDLAESAAARGDAGGTTEALVLTCPDQLAPATERALDNAGVEATVVPFPEGSPLFVDWVDYAERNQAADPVGFVAGALADSDGDTPVYAVVNTGYKTFEGKCDALVSALATDGAGMEILVEGDADNFFEGMALWARRAGN